MGKKDVEEKEYFNDVLHFADTCNGIMFGGASVILPEELEEANTELIYPDQKTTLTVRQDGIHYWRKQNVNIALIALEYQSVSDYHMVFRNMMAESLAYYKQWKKNKRHYSKEYKKWFDRLFRLRNSKEFLSGMVKEDQFVPVIIIVINFGLEKWDGATTLHEMLKLPSELERYVNNYKLNLFDYNDYEDFSIFKTEVRVIFEALKTAGNEEKMNSIFSRIKKIEIETARLLETLLNIEFPKKLVIKETDGKEYIEVCKAWDDHWKSGERAGIVIGEERGIEKGIEKGIEVFVKDKILDGVDESIIIKKLVFFYQVSDEKAKGYVEKYR